MYVIVGLGNPEDRYAGTRHNIGFEVINYFAQWKNIEVKRLKHRALIGMDFIQGRKVMLVKPQTYMNLSGESVLDIVQYYDVPMDKLLIIYDDVDLNVGKIRIKPKGSAGSHNGMKSIIYQLQDDNMPRLRIGIGYPEEQDLTHYVLKPFPREEREEIKQAVIRASQATECFILKGIDEAMNQFNG